MAIERRAEVTWEGGLDDGRGLVTASTSGALAGQGVSWPSRTSAPGGLASPEELLAGAHASCFAMALAGALGKVGARPQRLEVTATASFGQQGGRWTILSCRLEAHGSVPGLDEEVFARIAAEAKDDCPMSRALHGNVDVTVEAMLSAEDLAAAAGP
jgi:osmotically inducible protein OsmC